MSRPDVIDERFEAIVRELKAGALAAPPRLRERVLEIAGRPPEPPQPFRLSPPRLGLRRAALVLVPACLVLALAAAVAVGLVTSGSERERSAAPPATARELGRAADSAAPALGAKASGLPATIGRAQLYEAELTLRVRELSTATKRALQLARGFGGYVRTVDYGSGEEGGRASLVLRIPVGRVQEAIVRFSALGEILGQHVSIRDLQPQLDRRFRQMQGLRREIAKLQARLLDPGLTAAERATIEADLVAARQRLVAFQREQAAQRRLASFATVSLVLQADGAKPVRPETRNRIERALDNSGSILLDEAKVLVYAAVVGAPFLAVLALGIAGFRARRRRAERRLLER